MKVHNAKRERSTLPVAGVVTKQAMFKEETFQDRSLNRPSGKQDLWRWLSELRGATLDGRLKPRAPDCRLRRTLDAKPRWQQLTAGERSLNP